MIYLLFVGDGERDSVTVPRLVERIIGAAVKEETTHWARLHQQKAGKGYERKLLFALRQAKDLRTSGLIATVDKDRDRNRDKLRRLQAARNDERTRFPPFPTVLGEADPHAEAWLLDDPVAVRQSLNLPSAVEIVGVRKTKNPKEEIELLRRQSGRDQDDILEVLADIARAVTPDRCTHANETGFKYFIDEVRSELAPLFVPPPNATTNP